MLFVQMKDISLNYSFYQKLGTYTTAKSITIRKQNIKWLKSRIPFARKTFKK